MKRGQLYIVTGINGVGKQTASTLLMERMRQSGRRIERHYGPHMRKSAKRVYDSLLTEVGKYHDPYASALAFFSVHAEVAPEVTRLLEAGVNLILDRGPESTWVYQVVEQRLEIHQALKQSYNHVMEQLAPTKIFLLDAPVGVALERAKQQHAADYIQKQAVHHHERRRQAYLHLANQDECWDVIDANQPIEVVVQAMYNAVVENWET